MDNTLAPSRFLRRRAILIRPFLYPLLSLWSLLRSRGSPELPNERKDDNAANPATQVSISRKICNFIGCIVVTFGFFYAFFNIKYVLAIDTGLAILVAEYCDWSNRKVRLKGTKIYQQKTDAVKLAEEGNLNEKMELPLTKECCIVSVVGYREDPAIFTMALESYSKADGCKFVLACVDGNQQEDREMVQVFQEVYPTSSAILDLSVPFAEIALQMDGSKLTDEEIVSKSVALAKQIFREKGLHFDGPNAISRLCITQPHLHKKGIMFTSLVISIALSEILGIDFLWTSDSDSAVEKDTLTKTFATISGDERCAGASTALTIYNRNDSLVTKLGNTVFLNSGVSRCFTSAVGANDCQSGPCAAFRIKDLGPELMAWYKQTVCGHWMIINEDRHLTTRLLLRGHRILFIPDAFTATETPTTLRRWILQQVRWARSGHIESYAHPSIYWNHSPLLFLGALRRQLVSFFHLAALFWYFFSGTHTPFLNCTDYFYRVLITLAYLKSKNPAQATWLEWAWSIPTGVFYHALCPAFQAWSLLTVFADSWGTTMRGNKTVVTETPWAKFKNKVWDCGFFVLYMGIIGGVLGKWISATVGWHGHEMYASMGAGMASMWGGFGYWLMVVA